jgi:hypothetical protein
LLASTLDTTVPYTAGQTVAAPVIALTEGVIETMCLSERKTLAGLILVTLGLVAGLLAHQALADERPALPGGDSARATEKATPPARETRDQLTAESFAQLHKVILAQPDEYRWDAIPWFASLWHARKKAAAENKPLLVFRTHGAGFNDPLGNC